MSLTVLLTRSFAASFQMLPDAALGLPDRTVEGKTR
jgi:hypothetical protein